MIPISYYVIRRLLSRSRNRWAGCLVGFDPDNANRQITTSPIVAIEGRTVTTRSGHVYQLIGSPRWPEMYPGATEADPLNGAEPGYGFYLDGPGDRVWPVGAVVPAVDAGGAP